MNAMVVRENNRCNFFKRTFFYKYILFFFFDLPIRTGHKNAIFIHYYLHTRSAIILYVHKRLHSVSKIGTKITTVVKFMIENNYYLKLKD